MQIVLLLILISTNNYLQNYLRIICPVLFDRSKPGSLNHETEYFSYSNNFLLSIF